MAKRKGQPKGATLAKSQRTGPLSKNVSPQKAATEEARVEAIVGGKKSSASNDLQALGWGYPRASKTARPSRLPATPYPPRGPQNTEECIFLEPCEPRALEGREPQKCIAYHTLGINYDLEDVEQRRSEEEAEGTR